MTAINVEMDAFLRQFSAQDYKPIIPARSGFEVGVSPSEDEYLILCVLLRASNALSILEFGTCVGGSTRILALNAPHAQVYSIDLPVPRNDTKDEHEQFLVDLAQREPCLLARDLPNVALLKGDSRTYDYSAIPDCDFIFIDGGHDYATAKSDTYNAFRMLNRNNPHAMIVWHDCSNDMTPDVTRLTDELSEKLPIFGVLGFTLRYYSPCLRPEPIEEALDGSVVH
jgi:predicted O-methyltransferase YrrM